MSESDDRLDVAGLFNTYADALDRRAWATLDTVFAEDVEVDYAGAYTLRGRDKVVGMIRTYLDACGPSQHLMGNHRVSVDGDRATGTVKMRVHHVGAGDQAHLAYEVFGWYHAECARTADGWRVVNWRQEVTHELGTQEIFGLS